MSTTTTAIGSALDQKLAEALDAWTLLLNRTHPRFCYSYESVGSYYIRIVRTSKEGDPQPAAYGFVRGDGALLKANGWSMPATNVVRGSLFDNPPIAEYSVGRSA